MIEYDLAAVAGAVANAWLLALVMLRGGRPWLQATFAALGLTFILNGAAFVGTDMGLLPAAWRLAVFSTVVLAYPLAAILVLGLIHGDSLPRRKAVMFLLLAAVPLFVVATPSAEWTAEYAYDLNPVGGYLGICLAIALAEPIYEKMTSRLYSRHAEWLTLAVLVLIVGGPVYTIEFTTLGLPVAEGATLLAPAALALFAVATLGTAPYRGALPHGGREWNEQGRLPRGLIVFDEARPAYAFDELSREGAEGRPALLLAHTSESIPPDAADCTVIRFEPRRHAAARVLTTASEFFAKYPGAFVVLTDLGDLALFSGWAPTFEMVRRLRGVARGAHGTLVLATRCLTRPEREDLRTMHPAWWTLPELAEEFTAVLARSFGPGAKQLVARFAQTRGLRMSDLGPDSVPALIDFLEHAVLGQDAAVTDPAAEAALQRQTAAAVEDLRTFAARRPVELAEGHWPSKAPALTDRDLVVTADAYWEDRETEESAATRRANRPPFFDRALAVFVEYLGPAGESVLRSEVAKLGRQPQDLRAQDVARLADRAAVDLGAMAEVTDLPQEKVRIRNQVESIRRRLEAIAGVDA